MRFHFPFYRFCKKAHWTTVFYFLFIYTNIAAQKQEGLLAEKAMVVSAHPEASKIGVEILKKGGNAVDAAIAMQTFIIAAESVGLGCCPVSEIRNHIHSLSEELQSPQWVFPVAGLCVGWPASQSAISMRLPMDVTVMVDQYDDSKLIEQVEDYDHRRESVEQTPPEKQRLIEKFGVSSNYGWSENRSRQYSQAARDDFGQYIRDQGFNLT